MVVRPTNRFLECTNTSRDP